MRHAAAGLERDQDVVDRLFVDLKSVHGLRTAWTGRKVRFLRLRRLNVGYELRHGAPPFRVVLSGFSRRIRSPHRDAGHEPGPPSGNTAICMPPPMF